MGQISINKEDSLQIGSVRYDSICKVTETKISSVMCDLYRIAETEDESGHGADMLYLGQIACEGGRLIVNIADTEDLFVHIGVFNNILADANALVTKASTLYNNEPSN